jgi:hypothetical protein
MPMIATIAMTGLLMYVSPIGDILTHAEAKKGWKNNNKPSKGFE